MKKQLLVFLLVGLSINSFSQVFTGLDAIKKLSEFEGQRYLMNEILEISSHNFDTLLISKSITETDSDEGFILTIINYIFKGKKGVVISSASKTSILLNEFEFRNIHFTEEEFISLNQKIRSVEEKGSEKNSHYLLKFNNRLTVDIAKNRKSYYCILWIDNSNRHSFTNFEWQYVYNNFISFN